jgi:hypothetical protein
MGFRRLGSVIDGENGLKQLRPKPQTVRARSRR